MKLLSSECQKKHTSEPQVNTGPVNGLVPSGKQAITWAYVDPDLCRRMASLGHNELWYYL